MNSLLSMICSPSKLSYLCLTIQVKLCYNSSFFSVAIISWRRRWEEEEEVDPEQRPTAKALFLFSKKNPGEREGVFAGAKETRNLVLGMPKFIMEILLNCINLGVLTQGDTL